MLVTAASRIWLVLAIAACDSPRALFAPVDGGVDGDAAGDGGSIDAPEATDLVSMCGAEPVTLADWEACYAKRSCEALVNCQNLNLYRDAAECIAQQDAVLGGKLGFEVFERARAIAAGRASLDVAAFTQCLVELSPTKCSTAAHAPICETRFVGTVADNQLCYTDIECASPGATCAQPAVCKDSCCAGTCKPKPKLGQTCDDFVDGCEPGIVCGTDGVCVNGDIGSPCAQRYDCVPQAWCNNGTCAADLPAGSSCDSLLQCGGELSCVGLMRTEKPPACRRVTHEGDACDWYCFGNLYCDLSGGPGFGVCKALPVHGQTCSGLHPCLGVDQQCSPQSVCIDRFDAGETCSDGTCQPGLFCSDQVGAANPVCTARLDDGATGCNKPAQCQSYVCDGDANAVGGCQARNNTCP